MNFRDASILTHLAVIRNDQESLDAYREELNWDTELSPDAVPIAHEILAHKDTGEVEYDSSRIADLINWAASNERLMAGRKR